MKIYRLILSPPTSRQNDSSSGVLFCSLEQDFDLTHIKLSGQSESDKHRYMQPKKLKVWLPAFSDSCVMKMHVST
jgi:hypothetical protein